jgi:hypothetical protein
MRTRRFGQVLHVSAHGLEIIIDVLISLIWRSLCVKNSKVKAFSRHVGVSHDLMWVYTCRGALNYATKVHNDATPLHTINKTALQIQK